MLLSEYHSIIVNQNTEIKDFHCDDENLKNFLLNKAKNYSEELLAKTYVFENNTNTVAYFSIFNDNLRVEDTDFASKSSLKRFVSNLVSHPKRHLEYFPAIKLGRLAVSTSLRGQGYGEEIIKILIGLALQQNDVCACKVITVDAYANPKSLNFYEKMGFAYLTDKTQVEEGETKPTKPMYLDLTPFFNADKIK
ncbi:GNAT family N-acetyltransferase [Leeuwenhoekiella sp. A16]|uniref:GNAT family N-acetyltransferase n=1 Tax=unclassified Leeuwenhoekiella TaxID=2615029 RepID=UPI003A801F89